MNGGLQLAQVCGQDDLVTVTLLHLTGMTMLQHAKPGAVVSRFGAVCQVISAVSLLKQAPCPPPLSFSKVSACTITKGLVYK